MSGFGSRAARWIAGMALLVILGAAREGIANLFHRGPDKNAVDVVNQRLRIELGGQSIELPLEHLDVYLTESAGDPEVFELYGPNVMLAGQFPTDLRVDYEENWAELVNRSIPVAPSGGNYGEPKTSTITLPDFGPCRIVGGSLVVDSVGQNRDAKTPLQGTCTLRCATPDGEIHIRGTFSVLGTTWG